KYSWKLVKGNQVEMKGIKNKTVHVSKLEVGVYQFELTVTDAAGQSDSATVTVDVQKENNQPPIAIVTGDTAVYYPNTESVLNGSLSTDDYRIIQYHWSQLEGPNDIRFDGLDKPVLRVSGLHVEGVSPTEYLFQLVVIDYRNVTNYTNISVYYHKGEDVLPVADAGPDMILTLPQDTVTLNGTGSHDGFGISQYKWIKSDSSPAI
uniref:PKD domain-containing protein n=2 Tax=Amphimedon queenslandica TaxID=400682 RepID=A0A1X7SEH7_AMPQE